jgi:Fe-S cluster assembly scaffold protein SufB
MKLVGFNHDHEFTAAGGEAWRYTKLALPAELKPARVQASNADVTLSGNSFAHQLPAGVKVSAWQTVQGTYAQDAWEQLPIKENKLALRISGEVTLSFNVIRTDAGASIGALQFQLDPGAQLTLWQEIHGGAEGLSATALQFLLKDGAQLNHAFRSVDTGNGVHTVETHLAQNAKATVVGHVLGTGRTRLQMGTELAGEGAHATLATLFQLSGSGHGDLHSTFHHSHADTTAKQLAKNLLDHESKAIFTGKVHIAKNAQRVAASQMNRNLLLSKKAWAVGQPQLEIFADDVKCGHGSSTGQVGDNETFYLLSRGIPPHKARALLTRAFVAEVFHEAPSALRAKLEAHER